MPTHIALLLVLTQLPARGPVYRITARLDEVAGTLAARADVVVRNQGAFPFDTISLVVPGMVHLHDVVLGTAPPAAPTPVDGVIVLALPQRLGPGDSIRLHLGWTARPVRRRDREFAFAGWQPRIGSFADVRLRLDVPGDQVVSASATVRCGDPGWSPMRGPKPAATCDAAASGPGRKVIEWEAASVPEVALALSPSFQYEEGNVLEAATRAFYDTSGARAWGAGAAVAHLETAIAWLYEVFGSYPWPHATAVNIPGPVDTVVAMQLWIANSDQLHVLRELGRMYTGRLVSVNGAADAWLEDALARFQATWYLEEQGLRRPLQQLEEDVLAWELDGLARPIAQPRSTFPDSATARAVISRRGEFFLHHVRAMVGNNAMRAALHDYFLRNRFHDVDAAVFQSAIERATRRDLSSTFTQWLHRTDAIDYRIRDARRRRTTNGWCTDVTIAAVEQGRFPVALWVLTDRDTVAVRSNGRDARERFTVASRGRPRRVVLDPAGQSHDWNALNNQHTFGLHFGRDRPTARYLDTYFRRRTARDRLSIGVAPIVWRTDRGGWTVGVRRRDNYLGRYDLNEVILAATTGWDAPANRVLPQVSFEFRNPVSLRATGWEQRFGVFALDGRIGAHAGVTRSRRPSVTKPARYAIGVDLAWLTVETAGYVDPAFYDDAGTLELTTRARAAIDAGPLTTRLGVSLAGGWQHDNGTGSLADAAYVRLSAVATARSDPDARLSLGLRVYGGRVFSRDAVARQRLIYLAGADPYERMSSPFLRSPGAPLVRSDVRYHAPGGAGLRGLHPRLAARQAYGASLELEGALWRRRSDVARGARLALFADGALADRALGTGSGTALRSVAEAGAGVRIDHRFATTDFQTRWDFPIWISRPALAQHGPRTRQSGWRWVFSFSPSF